MRACRKLIVVVLLVSSCTGPAEIQGGLSIGVAPLSLPQLSKVCYDLRVTNDAGGLGSTVWAEGNPAVDGPTDTGAICSTSYGNGASGDITFVGSCDASPKNPGDVGRTNSVTVWVDAIYDGAGTLIAPSGNDGWQDPCPTGCTLDATCQENTDTAVEFNLTILRQANQGFFDIGVNFEDIFCSAKVDCKNAGGTPLALLFRPGTSTRDTTVVSALACTAGPGASVQTMLYRAPLVVSCSGAAPVIIDPRGQGNAWSTDATPTDAVFQYAVYAGEEDLLCGSVNCQKSYWNVAIGLDLARANTCTLSSTMTASSGGLTDFQTPASSTYPFIKVEVPLTTGTSLTCARHAVNADASVQTRYTSITQAESFAYDFDGENFHEKILVGVSCNALHLAYPALGSGTYTLDPDGAGGSAPFQAECDMVTSGGGWTRLVPGVVSSLQVGVNRQYLYSYGGRWYLSPTTQLRWNFTTGQQVTGTYSYWNGTTSGSFSCPGSGEIPQFGIGCSSGPGATAKVIPGYASNSTAGTATICQDIPNAFGVGPCRTDVAVWVR